MASAIDVTKPVAGSPTTESVRQNFAAAKSEIELLQQTAGVGPTGPPGPTGPAGQITVNPTIITGAAGTNASVAIGGTPQAATVQFTIPRGDSGTAGGGITETQAKDAVRQGNVRFEESPVTTAPVWPTAPNLAGIPVIDPGTGWTPETGGTATSAYTHASGTTPLAYPATITSGTFYQILFTMTNTSALTTGFFTIYFRTAPTVTTGQQTVLANVTAATTINVQATGNFSYLVIVPVTGWSGNFTLTRIVAFVGALNSASLSIKDWPSIVRTNSRFDGGGGIMSTGASDTAFGYNAMRSNTTAAGNTAVGFQSLMSNNTGGNNTAIGSGVMTANTTGANNTAVGIGALAANISGNYNVAIGQNALSSGRTALDNSTVGRQSLTGLLTGSMNAALGRGVMFAVTNAVGNTAIGTYAGRYIGPGTTSNTSTNMVNCVLVGYYAKTSALNQTNEIVIGSYATGHGSNTITLGNDAITALHCNVQTISALSDSRVKENIELANLDMCVNAVKNLPVHRWEWQPIAGVRRDKHVTGFLADDVGKVFPKAITKADEYLTVRDENGQALMMTVQDTSDEDPEKIEARQIEKTQEFKDLQYVSLTEALPTLWGAVQKLIVMHEELAKRLTSPEPPKQAPPVSKQPEPEPEPKQPEPKQPAHETKKSKRW